MSISYHELKRTLSYVRQNYFQDQAFTHFTNVRSLGKCVRIGPYSVCGCYRASLCKVVRHEEAGFTFICVDYAPVASWLWRSVRVG